MQKRKVNRHPLRRVVGERYDQRTGRIIETLECGHEVPRKQDIIGETNAVRRRCRRCGAERG